MKVKLSRRDLGLLALAPQALAQDAPPEEDELREALAWRRKQSEALGRHEVPMNTEPAFVFKP